jgi:hypothetical protein
VQHEHKVDSGSSEKSLWNAQSFCELFVIALRMLCELFVNSLWNFLWNVVNSLRNEMLLVAVAVLQDDEHCLPSSL